MAPRKKSARVIGAAAWKNFYETTEGRVAIGALMAHFGVYGSINHADPTSMAVAVGERNVCAWLAEQIGIRDEAYVDERSEVEKLTDKLLAQYGA